MRGGSLLHARHLRVGDAGSGWSGRGQCVIIALSGGSLLCREVNTVHFNRPIRAKQTMCAIGGLIHNHDELTLVFLKGFIEAICAQCLRFRTSEEIWAWHKFSPIYGKLISVHIVYE